MQGGAAAKAGPCGDGHSWDEDELESLRKSHGSDEAAGGHALYCRRCRARMGEVERLFHKLDHDGSGQLEHCELLSLSHRLFSSEEDRSAVADPADIDGERAALEEALVQNGCDWAVERDGLGLVCKPSDFEWLPGEATRRLKDPSAGREQQASSAVTAEQVVRRLLAEKTSNPQSFGSRLRDAGAAFRGMLADIDAADSEAVTLKEFSDWWKEIGSEVQRQSSAGGELEPQHSDELEIDDDDVIDGRAHEHETMVYLTSLEAVEDEHSGKRSHIEYYFEVRVFGVSRYRFHGRFSRLLDVHTQMKRAGCLDKEPVGAELMFPPKSGLLEAAWNNAHTTEDEKVQERGEELCRYYRHLFASKQVMSHDRTKAILGFDRSDVDVAKELMKEAHVRKTMNKATAGGREAELKRRTPRWGEAKKDYTKDKYGAAGFQDGDLEIHKARGKGDRGDIIVVGLHDEPGAGDELDPDADDWCEGVLRFPGDKPAPIAAGGGRGHFPKKGFAGKDCTHDFVEWLSVAEVAKVVRSQGDYHKLVQAEHRFDKATYGPDWDEEAHKGTWDEKAQEFMKGEFLVLVAQPHSDGWGEAVTFRKYSEGLGPGEGADWKSVAKFIPALPGFVNGELEGGVEGGGACFPWG